MGDRGPVDFDAAYEGTPPWDIDRPQPAFERPAEDGAVRGSVLDVGCGTGEHAFMHDAMASGGRFSMLCFRDSSAGRRS